MRTAPALLSALAVAAVVVASLTGCTSSGSSSSVDSASCTPYYRSGAASSTVKVSGKKTAAAKATFPTPLIVKTPQVTQNNAGTGAKIQDGDQVDYEFTVFDGKTGDSLGSAGYGASGSTTPRSGVAALLDNKPTYSVTRSLQCATTGERYTLVTTAKDGFGTGALAQSGIKDSDVLVLVISVVDHFAGKSNGANQLPQDGLPSVITAVNGQPGIVVQEQSVPKTLRIETVKSGSGPIVKKNETVRVKYSGWTWPVSTSDKPMIWPGGQDASGNTVPAGNSSWTTDRAGDIKVTSTGLPVGLYRALVGARVGSQVLVVIPPKDGFGAASASYGFSAKDTVVMVIDVLGIK